MISYEIQKCGGPEGLKLGDRSLPHPGDHDVVVRIKWRPSTIETSSFCVDIEVRFRGVYSTAQEAARSSATNITLSLPPKADSSNFWLSYATKSKSGQRVAVQRNSFGEVVEEYTSGVEGDVSAVRRDATSEPGNYSSTTRAP